MKLVVFGTLLRSNAVHDREMIWRPLCRALAQRGHAIVFFQHGHVATPSANPDDWPYGELRPFLELGGSRDLVRQHLADADVAIVSWDFAEAAAVSELVLESRVPLRVFHALDAALTVGRLSPEPGGYPGPRGLAGFDLVLSSLGGRALDDLLLRFGARRVAALMPGVEADRWHAVQPVERFRSDLSYLGAYDREVESTLAALLVKPARRLPQRRFVIGGAGYPGSFPWTENMSYFRGLQPENYPSAYVASRLTLNVTPPARRAIGFCPSLQLFEAAVCGVTVVCDGWEGLELFFEPGSEILPARDADDVLAAVELPDAALARIGERARERVLDEHTAMHRARHLEIVLENAMRAPEEETLSAMRRGRAIGEPHDAGRDGGALRRAEA